MGSWGNSLVQKIRRFFTGSISRRVLQRASCPVMIVVLPKLQRPNDLVQWYEEAIARYLQEQRSTLMIFIPRMVAQMFVPPNKKTAGRKELAAATLALEQLTHNGILCGHEVKGK